MVKTGLTRVYADSMEEIDFRRLREFVDRSRFFDDVSADTYCNTTDAFAARGGRMYCIEVKSRTYVHDAFNDWYIEADKVSELYRKALTIGTVPIVINFFSDGYTAVWCIDPNRGGFDPGEPVKRRVKNPGTGEVEITAKYALPMKNAIVYDENFRRRQ